MSDWKRSAAKRRDTRRTAVPAIRPPGGSSKDTKKWCRGKVGTPHKPECMSYNTVKRVGFPPEWRLLVCTSCRKELDYFMPLSFGNRTTKKPAWVTT